MSLMRQNSNQLYPSAPPMSKDCTSRSVLVPQSFLDVGTVMGDCHPLVKVLPHSWHTAQDYFTDWCGGCYVH